jgi:hypothetical protein
MRGEELMSKINETEPTSARRVYSGRRVSLNAIANLNKSKKRFLGGSDRVVVPLDGLTLKFLNLKGIAFHVSNIVAMKYPRVQLSPKEQIKARIESKRVHRQALRKEFPNEDPIEALSNLFAHLPYRDNITDEDFD